MMRAPDSLLARELMRMGLERFTVKLAAPLTVQVGLAGARRDQRVSEHAFSQKLAAFPRTAAHNIHAGHPTSSKTAQPILLTRPSGRDTRTGAGQVEAVLTTHDAPCLRLGAQTPLADTGGGGRI
jgi:hypothetical protein